MINDTNDNNDKGDITDKQTTKGIYTPSLFEGCLKSLTSWRFVASKKMYPSKLPDGFFSRSADLFGACRFMALMSLTTQIMGRSV